MRDRIFPASFWIQPHRPNRKLLAPGARGELLETRTTAISIPTPPDTNLLFSLFKILKQNRLTVQTLLTEHSSDVQSVRKTRRRNRNKSSKTKKQSVGGRKSREEILLKFKRRSSHTQMTTLISLPGDYLLPVTGGETKSIQSATNYIGNNDGNELVEQRIVDAAMNCIVDHEVGKNGEDDTTVLDRYRFRGGREIGVASIGDVGSKAQSALMLMMGGNDRALLASSSAVGMEVGCRLGSHNDCANNCYSDLLSDLVVNL